MPGWPHLSYPIRAAAAAQRKTTQSASYVIIDPMYATILEGNKPRGLLMWNRVWMCPTVRCARGSCRPYAKVPMAQAAIRVTR